MSDRCGQQVDQYRLLRLLGSGGFGQVYLAEPLREQGQVAIKLLPPLAAEDLHTFLSEARMIRLRHPHIVPILDFGLDGQTPFLVMEYAPQGTLRKRHPRGARLPVQLVLQYVRQLASALQYAHDHKLIHRDIKPANMLVGPNNEVLLSDFGLVLLAQSTGSQSTKELAGTFAYMAPEQLQGKPRPQSDQYALGIVVYEWLSGECPFQGSSAEVASQHLLSPPPPLAGRIAGITPAIEQVVLRALAKDPQHRFPTVQAFASALAHACRDSRPLVAPVLPLPATPAPPAAQATGQSARSVASAIHGPSEARVEEAAPLVTGPAAPFPSTARLSEPVARWPERSANPSLQPTRTSPFPPVTPDVAADPPRGEASRKSAPRQGRLSTRRTLLLLGLLLFLVFASASAWLTVQYQQDQTHQQMAATAQALAPPAATVTAAIGAYNTAVAAQGIMFGFDAQHTRVNPYEQILNPDNVVGLAKDWTYQTGGDIDSSPTVVNGLVYVGSDNQSFYAIDATTGSKRWAFSTGGVVNTSPAVVNGIVYIGSADYYLYALDALSGSKRWAYKAQDHFDSSPTVVNGVVYAGSFDGHLYAIDAASGTRRWAFATSGPIIGSSPAVTNGIVYVGSDDGMLYAIDAASGNKRWVFPAGDHVYASPTVVNGIVYVGTNDGILYALDALSGSKRWTFTTGGAGISSCAVMNGIVYIGSDDGMLYAIDATSGNKRWAFLMGEHGVLSPTIANGIVYAASGNGMIYAIHAQSGRKLWTFSTGSDIIDSSPTVVNGGVYIGTYAGVLYAFHLPERTL